jgi:hypothetical protein
VSLRADDEDDENQHDEAELRQSNACEHQGEGRITPACDWKLYFFAHCFAGVVLLRTDGRSRFPYDWRMANNISLAAFVSEHRTELISRCRPKVATRSSPPTPYDAIDYGVPLFLVQLSKELTGDGTPETAEISATARARGRQLLNRGFTVDQVVRDYGDVCQSVTELAVETDTTISAQDFRTLNQCLDDAIAGAVTAFAEVQDIARDGELTELWSLVNSASAAFEAMQSGRVGVDGRQRRCFVAAWRPCGLTWTVAR